MKILLFVTLIALAFVALCSAEGNVVVLSPDNFDTVVDGSKTVFVKFYAPWCGHCKKLAPDFEILADTFAPVSNKVVIAKVDCDQADNKALCSKYDVSGYPTLKIFDKSTTAKDYNGARSVDELLTYINNHAKTNVKVKKAPSNVVDLSPSNFDSVVLDKSKNVLVEFYAPWCGHCKKLMPDYEILGNTYANEKDVVIAKIDCDAADNKAICSKYGVTGFPTLKWFGKQSKDGEKYEQGRDLDTFINYINKQAGVNRVKGGKLAVGAGRVEQLDTIATEFIAAAAEVRKELVKKAQTVVDSLPEELRTEGSYYVKVMKTIAEKSIDFVTTEIARITKLVSGSMSGKKADEFAKKLNILESFKSK
ncbi:protein disulfide isomerase [Dictyostelium discoideum AX4]|uniref:Protein disulfide-isomerase 1 n=1 Tax=Dictyostelium discoideum TaxID=44689 RepID=PDI1_DICDI|nr:protein disulfide isomerase [Dictyostelium discoideum AX4]Q86IA3.2 RecName: Full=Protein disulfide-isomerase 1; Short=PDI1; Flags: Precursor [Dictyostelium discoideum]EAL69370.1 protein disulfide isomerase [Dictyostelium discoideum AX4]|eukprot:XP_643357.1 protein disulfide isomerase [Dictyostelium discoideum AX4]